MWGGVVWCGVYVWVSVCSLWSVVVVVCGGVGVCSLWSVEWCVCRRV